MHDTDSLWSSTELDQGAHPHAVPEVQAPCCGRTRFDHGEQALGQLDSVHSFGHFRLPGLSEEGSEGSDELLLVHLFYSNSKHPKASMLAARGKEDHIFLIIEKT